MSSRLHKSTKTVLRWAIWRAVLGISIILWAAAEQPIKYSNNKELSNNLEWQRGCVCSLSQSKLPPELLRARLRHNVKKRVTLTRKQEDSSPYKTTRCITIFTHYRLGIDSSEITVHHGKSLDCSSFIGMLRCSSSQPRLSKSGPGKTRSPKTKGKLYGFSMKMININW